MASIINGVSMCAIVCCFARSFPMNMILLGVFTICEAYMVAGMTAQYKKEIVI